MPAISEKKRYTYEDYAKLPEGAPYQLIGGELVVTPSPVPYHQIILMKIGTSIANYVMPKNLGLVLFAPIDVYLEEEETYQPDIIFISNKRMNIVGEKKIEGAPDLVIEILSPSTAYYDLRKKYWKYEEYGVKEYWIVDPDGRSVEVYINENKRFVQTQSAVGQGICRSKIIDGFELDIEKVF